MILGCPGIPNPCVSLKRPEDYVADRDPIRLAHEQWVRRGWAAAADGMAMITSLTRVQQLLMERIDAVLRPLELTFARYEVLMLLSFSRGGRLPMSRVGSLLQVHPTSATSAVDRLERQGFVKRVRDVNDGRVVLACITPRGKKVAERATAGLNSEVFERPGLGVDQTAELTHLLGALRAAAGDHVELSLNARTS
jgi:DNA-binding MarR family transcriptional regulator